MNSEEDKKVSRNEYKRNHNIDHGTISLYIGNNDNLIGSKKSAHKGNKNIAKMEVISIDVEPNNYGKNGSKSDRDELNSELHEDGVVNQEDISKKEKLGNGEEYKTTEMNPNINLDVDRNKGNDSSDEIVKVQFANENNSNDKTNSINKGEDYKTKVVNNPQCVNNGINEKAINNEQIEENKNTKNNPVLGNSQDVISDEDADNQEDIEAPINTARDNANMEAQLETLSFANDAENGLSHERMVFVTNRTHPHVVTASGKNFSYI